DHPEHLGMHRLVKDLNRAYADAPAIWSRDSDPDSFQWIDANDAGRNVFSFIRRSGEDELACVCNFAAVPHGDFVLGLPAAGQWHEVLNTDASSYSGSGVGNMGAVTAREGGVNGQPAQATVVVPPLATIWLRRG